MYILDTNVISELRKSKAEPKVLDWAQSVDASKLYISVITILELRQGILIKARKDKKQANILQTWLEHKVLKAFAGRIIPIDTEVALKCAQLHVPDPSSERDALIGASALIHNKSLVTRNVKDFISFKLPIINPWV